MMPDKRYESLNEIQILLNNRQLNTIPEFKGVSFKINESVDPSNGLRTFEIEAFLVDKDDDSMGRVLSDRFWRLGPPTMKDIVASLDNIRNVIKKEQTEVLNNNPLFNNLMSLL